MALTPGTIIGPFTVGELLYADPCGYRAVYLAEDPQCAEAPYAVELTVYTIADIPPALSSLPEKEARAAAIIHDAETVDSFIEGDLHVIVLPSFPGSRTLASMTRGELAEAHLYPALPLAIKRLNDTLMGRNIIHFGVTPATVRIAPGASGAAPSIRFDALHLAMTLLELSQRSLEFKSIPVRFRAPEMLTGTTVMRSAIFMEALTLAWALYGTHPWGFTEETSSYHAFQTFRKEGSKLPEQFICSCTDALMDEDFNRATIAACLREALHPMPKKRLDDLERFHAALLGPYLPAPETSETSETPETAETRDTCDAPAPKGAQADSSDRSDRSDRDEPARKQGKPKMPLEPEPRQEPEPPAPDGSPRLNVTMRPRHGDGFKAVAGMESLKDDLRRDFIDVVNNTDLARQYGLRIPSILLYGPPGTGKTYLATRLAEELRLDFTLITPSDLGNIYVHGSQQLIRQLFDKAEKTARRNKRGVLLLFDEFDAVCPQRTADDNSKQGGEVAEFLTQLNDCAERGIYVIGTTNCLDRVDKAVLRKGRIDRVIYVGLPDDEARRALFRYELSCRPHSSRINFDRLAELTGGYTSSDISYIVTECARDSFARALKGHSAEPVKIRQKQIEEVIAKTRPSVTGADVRSYEKMRDLYASGRRDTPASVGFIR